MSGNYAAFYCNECGSVMRFHVDCKRRVCVSCNKKRSDALIRKYENIDDYLINGNTYFCTLTLKNVMSVKNGVVRVRRAFKKLIRRHPYCEWFAGGMYAIETSPNDDWSYNVHIHACIDSCINIARCYKTEFNKDWYECTGDSYVTDWQSTRHPGSAIRYCLKYSSKEVSYYDPESVEAALKGVRVLSFFGVLYNCKGVSLETGDFVCLSCGSEYVSFYCYGNMPFIEHDLKEKLDFG